MNETFNGQGIEPLLNGPHDVIVTLEALKLRLPATTRIRIRRPSAATGASCKGLAHACMLAIREASAYSPSPSFFFLPSLPAPFSLSSFLEIFFNASR